MHASRIMYIHHNPRLGGDPVGLNPLDNRQRPSTQPCVPARHPNDKALPCHFMRSAKPAPGFAPRKHRQSQRGI